MKKYVVELTTQERCLLETVSKDSKSSAQHRRLADLLLAVDQGAEGPAMKDTDVAKALRCWPRTVECLRCRFVEQGLEACLERGNIGAPRKKAFDGATEARLIALGCSAPPPGHVRWTL